MPMHMAAIPFLFAMPIVWLLLPAIQAHSGPIGYPDAAAPAHWTNSPSLRHTVNFTDGSSIRAIVLNNLYDVHQGPSFAAGFYCMAPCDSFLFAVYIVIVDYYGDIVDEPPQVIWAANLGSPIRENATLSLTADGGLGLVLRDADGSDVWAFGRAAAGLSITRSGNLVLLDDNNVSVWQSFDDPTDCLVPGQILAEGMKLTPNAAANNWTISEQLYMTVLADGLYGFIESSPPQLYYRNTVTPAGNRKTNMTLTNGSLVISASSSTTVAKLNMSEGMAYIRLESDGHLKLYQFKDGGWQMVQDILEGQVAIQAQPKPIGVGYPDAAAPTRWTNSPSLQRAVTFNDGSVVRPIVLNNLHDVYQGPSFAAGFYCMPPCDSFLFAVYIVIVDYYSDIVNEPPQVIWAANRGSPIRENATLSLTADGGLVLRNADGSLVWSADSSGKAVAGLSITRSGNLVLLDGNNVSVWQSFDHPADSMVPGQILAEGMWLTSNASANNSMISNQLYVTVLADGLYAFAESSPPQLYYKHTVTQAGNRKTHMTLTNGSLVISASSNVTVANTLKSDTEGMMYLRLESDGHLKLYQYGKVGQQWQMVQDILEGQLDDCAYPTVCGEYGICINGQCTCPMGGNTTYFKQIDDLRINLGCTPVTPVSCASAPDHQLVALSNIFYFNCIDQSAALLPERIDEESCKKACLSNCSCKAAFFLYRDDTTGFCWLPTQLFSLQLHKKQYANYAHSSPAYLKVQITHSPPNPVPSNSSAPMNRSTSNGQKTISSGAIVGYTFAGVISLLIMVIISSVILWRRYQLIEDDEDFGEVSGMTTKFTFEQLKVATEEFSRMLGKGGFGSVFEGQVGEQKIAVKKLDRAGQGKKEFLAEIETIGSIHHINLVRLIGFCAEKSHRLLVYEYMSKGSLDRWIYCRDDCAPLSWNTRNSIITDIAKGLAYLHEDCRQRIAHLDIKPQNILLDDNFSAKLSDFGLSKMIDRDRSQVITRMRGTPGYLAPEWLTSQFITEKVDVYSFGVVVMEIISGRKNLDYSQPEDNIHLISILQEKARNNQLEQLIDSNCDDMQTQKEEVIHMMKLAMWCLQIDCNKRPQMSVVVKILEGTVNVESNIEFNFVAVVTSDLGNDAKMASSAQALASYLSGPR